MEDYSIFVWSKNYSKNIEKPIWEFPSKHFNLKSNEFSSSLNGEFLFLYMVINLFFLNIFL